MHIHNITYNCTLLLHPGIQNSIINISFDLQLWFHTISHDYLPVLSVLVQLWTPDIRSPDWLLFYLTAIMPPRTYIAFALIFIYSDAAVRSCLVISFFTLAWADELAVPSIDSFDLTAHSRRTDVYMKTDCHNLPVTVFRIPHTKCSKDGKDIYCATQPGPINPVFELKNQLAINDPPPNAHLFTYCHANGHWTSIQSP